MEVDWKHYKTLKIKTKDFSLLSLNENDITDLQVSWLKDKQVIRWLNSYYKKHTIQSLKEFVKKFDNYNSFHLGIFINDKKIQIGNFSILIDHFHKTAEIRVLVGNKDWWGKGVVLQCREAIIDWLFLELNLYKVYGSPLVKNIAAIFNYQKQGFECECILKNHKLTEYKERCDVAIFSLYREDWIKRLKK